MSSNILPASPYVSCILPFSNPYRINLVRKAVNNFIYQRYTPYELLIVNGTNQSVLTNADMDSQFYSTAGCSVREIQTSPGLNAAAMRNVALKSHAAGDYIICIDDDDYFHPDRLLYQMAHRRLQNPAPCMLRYQLRVDLTGVLGSFDSESMSSLAASPKLHLLAKKDGIASTAVFPRLDLDGNPWLFNEDLNTGEHEELIDRITQKLGFSVFDNKHTPFNAGSNLPLLSVAMYHGGNELNYQQFFEQPDISLVDGMHRGDIEFLKSILRSYNFQVN